MKYIKLYEELEEFEEVWEEEPYEDENMEIKFGDLKSGDKVIILEKLKDYVYKKEWIREMLYLINNIYEVNNPFYKYITSIDNEKDIPCFYINQADISFATFYIPYDCARKI